MLSPMIPPGQHAQHALPGHLGRTAAEFRPRKAVQPDSLTILYVKLGNGNR